MSTKIHTGLRGFTIIEVLIVLVVGSLILTMVFVAIPQLRRNQRNYSRKADVRLLVLAVSDCITLNGLAKRCSTSDRIRLDPEVDFSIFEDFAVQKGGDADSGGLCGETTPVKSAMDYKTGAGPRSINNVCDNMPVIWLGKRCQETDVSAGGLEEGESPNDFAVNYPIEGRKSVFFNDLIGFCTDSTYNSPEG